MASFAALSARRNAAEEKQRWDGGELMLLYSRGLVIAELVCGPGQQLPLA
jgi:hypothetical protein